MGKVIVTDSNLSAIASAIRGKAGTASLYTPAQMASAITNLPSGGITPSGTYSISANGIYDVTNYASANVSVPSVAPSISALTVTENGTYSVPSGVDGYNPVTVNVAGGGGGGFTADDIAERTISGTVTGNAMKIGSNAFINCTNLTLASFPSVSIISSYAFYGCTSLVSANFPNASMIYGYAFSMCSKLTTVNFPKVSTISDNAFRGCSSLSSIYFPSANLMSDNAFSGCTGLTSAEFPKATQMYNRVFQSCSSLASINMPLMWSIGGSVFMGCKELHTVSFPKVAYIGAQCFASCYNLLSVYLLGSSVATLSNSNAFLSTPISTYTTSTGGVQGSIFVRASLYQSWITKANWSVYSARFVSLTDEQIAAL